MVNEERPAFPHRIGFVGLGNIGRPMAETLIEAGFDLTVYDKRPEPMEACVEAGARAAGGPGEIASTCDVVEIVVRTEAQVEAVVTGDDGVLAGLEPGDVIVVHSTVPPSAVVRLADRAAASGVGLIDAAVSGGDVGAESGTLTVMVGGETELVERCRPIFDALGTEVFHVGDVGTGEVAKLGNNMMTHCNHLVALEAMKLASAYGIDEDTMAQVASASTGGSWHTENWGFFDRFMDDHTLAGSEDLFFFMRQSSKDAVRAAEEEQVPVPITGLCTELRPTMLADRYEELQERGR